MIGTLTVNGQDLSAFGCYVTSSNSLFASAQPDVEKIKVPGKNGDLTYFNGKYNNITITYSAFIYYDFAQNFSDLRNFLSKITDYVKIEDSFNDNEYRMGRFLVDGKSFSPIVVNDMTMGHFTLSFDCKPQRFLVSGDAESTFSASGTITNPTSWASEPLITVYGTGNGILDIGNYRCTITGMTEALVINSDIQDCYKPETGVNLNSLVALSNGFPKIESGNVGVQFSGDITSVKIKPRWWKL